MYLLIMTKNKKIYKISLEELEQYANDYSFIISTNKEVKEIVFSHELSQSCPNHIFKSLHEQLSVIPTVDIQEFGLIIDNNINFIFSGPIKEFMYRDLGYGKCGEYNINETLSIRFQENNLPIIDNNNKILKCNHNCIYYDKNKCKKYNDEIFNDIICKMCFLEMSEPIEKQYLNEIYENTKANYSRSLNEYL